MIFMIKRELYLSKIRKFIDKEEIKAITGVRRCGKTCLLKQIIDELEKRGVNNENILYVSLESSKYDNIKDYVDLNEYIFKQTENLKGKIYLLFDEIQLVSNWEKSINAYRIDLNCDIYITGSNSKLLSGELATLISGRYIKIDLYPFSFNEIFISVSGNFLIISLNITALTTVEPCSKTSLSITYSIPISKS